MGLRFCPWQKAVIEITIWCRGEDRNFRPWVPWTRNLMKHGAQWLGSKIQDLASLSSIHCGFLLGSIYFPPDTRGWYRMHANHGPTVQHKQLIWEDLTWLTSFSLSLTNLLHNIDCKIMISIKVNQTWVQGIFQQEVPTDLLIYLKHFLSHFRFINQWAFLCRLRILYIHMYSALHINSPFARFMKSNVALAWLGIKFSSIAPLKRPSPFFHLTIQKSQKSQGY